MSAELLSTFKEATIISTSGELGPPGLTAYQLAVRDQGFQGTLEEWLLSIKGDKGDDGDQGDSGLSAYEVALKNGFEGDEEEWLDSLKGDTGSIRVFQDRGFSELSVMSQDAVTRELESIEESIESIDSSLYLSVEDDEERLSIPEEKRVIGMIVFVRSTNEEYYLLNDITNESWVLSKTGALGVKWELSEW